MYTFDSRVRYSETDEYGRLSVLGIINYMQDCSTLQSEDAKVGVGFLDQNHKAWLLSSWRINIDRYPKLGEAITVGTWPTSFKGIYGYRDFVLRDRTGADLVRAHSIWFLYDTERQTPIRVQPEDTAPYGREEAPLALDPSPRRLSVPEHFRAGEPVQIARHHLDTNHHVNNAQYVDMAREAIPQGLTIREIRADYKKAALLGDIVLPSVTEEEDGWWTVALKNTAGEAYAVIQLLTEPVQCM